MIVEPKPRGTRAENERRFISDCCSAPIVFGAGRQWWCSSCCEDVPPPVSAQAFRASEAA